MSKNNPQYENSIVGRSGEIVVAGHEKSIQVRCIEDDGMTAVSVFLYPHQIPHLIDQLEAALEENRRKVYIL